MNLKGKILSSKILVAAIIVLGLAFCSCSDTRSTQSLSPEVKYMSDTMYNRRKSIIEDELDSLCLERIPLLKQKAIDSLLIIEQERIRELSE